MEQRSPTRLLLSILAFAAPVLAQAAEKVVVHDHGDLWPESFVVRDDGSVAVYGNPWLGGDIRILGVSGINDLARLDALSVGDSESVAMVGDNGLTMATWNQALVDFDLTTWSDPQLAGALAVRSASFVTSQLVAVLAADGQTLRCYRSGGSPLSVFTMSEPVLDFQAFRHANGSPRILVLTASGLTCVLATGTVKWSLPGNGGAIAICRGQAAFKAIWMHRNELGAWRLARIGDAAVLGVDDVSAAFENFEQLVAGFAVDCDDDGDADWLAKTSAGVSVLLNPGADQFALAVEQSLPQLVGSVTCIPDVVVTHGGAHVHVVDEQQFAGLGWSELNLMGEGAGSSLIDVIDDGVVDNGITAQSRIEFTARVAPNWLSRFAQPGTRTYLQVVAWRQDSTATQGRMEVAESNVLFELLDIPASITEETVWPLSASMLQSNTSGAWDDQVHYWLTVRLVMTELDAISPIRVSDPVTLGTTLSWYQQNVDWDYLRDFRGAGHEFDPLPELDWEPSGLGLGGGVVGVITRIRLPPPPPPGGVPAPGANTGVTTSIRQQVPN